jgi:hypothetical protein
MLARNIKAKNLDKRLETTQYHRGFHNSPRDALQPEDVQALGAKFPHWGDRLYKLWKEADEPAPVSQLGWWSESKKSPRFTYWAGIIALSFAVVFGILATVLSALQVWISYCTWKNDPMSSGCRRLG